MVTGNVKKCPVVVVVVVVVVVAVVVVAVVVVADIPFHKFYGRGRGWC